MKTLLCSDNIDPDVKRKIISTLLKLKNNVSERFADPKKSREVVSSQSIRDCDAIVTYA
jgi:hypothetical protein